MANKIKIETVREGASWKVGSNGETVRIFKTRNHKRGYDFFEVRWRVGKRPHRRYRTKFEEACHLALETHEKLAAGKQEVSEFSSSNLLYLAECQKRLGETPLHVAVEFYLKNFSDVSPRGVFEAVNEFISVQDGRDCSDRYVGTLKNRLEPFRDTFVGRDTHDISLSEVADYIAKKGWAAKTQANFLGTYQSFLRFCVDRRYASKKSLDGLKTIPLSKERATTPEIFSPVEMVNLLALCKARDLPFVVITGFAGGRRAEVQRLKWGNIDMEERVIRLDSEITKTNSRRVLEINDTVLAWLEILPRGADEDLIVELEDPLMDIRDRFRERKLEWKHNALRHSFISYDLACFQNAARTAELSGTSPAMIRKHYKALASKKTAQTYFGLTPSKVRDLCVAQGVELMY